MVHLWAPGINGREFRRAAPLWPYAKEEAVGWGAGPLTCLRILQEMKTRQMVKSSIPFQSVSK